MKFGKTFEESRHHTWRSIEYNTLKALLKSEVSVELFAAALYDEVQAVDSHFERIRRNMDGERKGMNDLRSHAVLNYLAVMKIQKKACKHLPGGRAALELEDGWEDLLQASFCQMLLGSSIFTDDPCAGSDADDESSPTSCPVCLQSTSLSTLSCGHGVCASCLAHCASAGLEDRCPICRVPCTLDPACARIESFLGLRSKKYAPAANLRPRRVTEEEYDWTEHDGEADLEDAEMACEAVPSLAGPEDECKADVESTLQLEAYANAAKAVRWASRGNLNPDA